MTATHVDHWTEGYRAALDGATYQDNPHEGKQGATAWAFGCGEGMRAQFLGIPPNYQLNQGVLIITATLLDPAEVFAAFWAVALEDAQLSENDSACSEGRDPEQFDGEPAAEYGPKYRAAIDSICAQAEPILAELDLNRFPRDKGESSLSDIFGSDLYMTSHGHGVGFWDGDWGPAGDALDELAKQAPSGDLAHHKDGGFFFL